MPYGHCPVCQSLMTGFNTLVFCPRCEASPPRSADSWYTWEPAASWATVGITTTPLYVSTEDRDIERFLQACRQRGSWKLYRVSSPDPNHKKMGAFWEFPTIYWVKGMVSYLELVREFTI